jgi:hypothetical protein
MEPSSTISVLDRMLDPLSDCLNSEAAQRIVALGIEPAVQARIEELADRSTELRGAFIVGVTPAGRTTVHVLAKNSRHRLNVRAELIAQGLYP